MTVYELIEQLRNYHPDRLVIIDNDGNTEDCPAPALWDEKDYHDNSPVAFFIT